MKKRIRNLLQIIIACLFVAVCCFLPNIQAKLMDWKTFGKNEKIALNPVEISVEATQTTLEKLKIVNNHVLCVSVAPSARTVDGNDLERTSRKQVNQLFREMKLSYRVNDKWKLSYKKLYTYISKEGNLGDSDIADISDTKNLLVWNLVLAPRSKDDDKEIALVMDAYTDQILAIDVYLSDYAKDWKDLADHLEDIPKGYLSYLNLEQSEMGLKKNLLENAKIKKQYQNGKKSGSYLGISAVSGIYAKQDKKRVYVSLEWSGYGFMINNAYD